MVKEYSLINLKTVGSKLSPKVSGSNLNRKLYEKRLTYTLYFLLRSKIKIKKTKI